LRLIKLSSDVIQKSKIICVGAGLFNLTLAERIAEELNLKVLIIEKRDHIGGNAYSEIDLETSIEYHKYGSHIFHTSNKKVWDYVSKFTKFNNYQHFVYSINKNNIYSMPINLLTINNFFNTSLAPEQAKAFLSSKSAKIPNPVNLRDKAISQIGIELYEALIEGYTKKQWQIDPVDLPAEIINRLPVRYDFNTRYFSDIWEGIPIDGYTAWFLKMVKNDNISVAFNSDFFNYREHIPNDAVVIYSGPLDKFFNFKFGRLSWRTLDFELERHDLDDFQGNSVINYADINVPYTRIHEFKHLHPERNYLQNKTLISKEFSRFAGDDDEPYYPVNSSIDRNILKKYRLIAEDQPRVFFGGRLGTYKYLDMHMAIASALSMYENILKSFILKENL